MRVSAVAADFAAVALHRRFCAHASSAVAELGDSAAEPGADGDWRLESHFLLRLLCTAKRIKQLVELQ